MLLTTVSAHDGSEDDNDVVLLLDGEEGSSKEATALLNDISELVGDKGVVVGVLATPFIHASAVLGV